MAAPPVPCISLVRSVRDACGDGALPGEALRDTAPATWLGCAMVAMGGLGGLTRTEVHVATAPAELVETVPVARAPATPVETAPCRVGTDTERCTRDAEARAAAPCTAGAVGVFAAAARVRQTGEAGRSDAACCGTWLPAAMMAGWWLPTGDLAGGDGQAEGAKEGAAERTGRDATRCSSHGCAARTEGEGDRPEGEAAPERCASGPSAGVGGASQEEALPGARSLRAASTPWVRCCSLVMSLDASMESSLGQPGI